MKHALQSFPEIEKRLILKNILFCLDFDGTLTPIVSTPKRAVLARSTRNLLWRISRIPKIRLAFISGRKLSDLKKRIGIRRALYAGNHGFELCGFGLRLKLPITRSYRVALRKIENRLRKNAASIPGVFLENKTYSLGYHYRLVDRKNIKDAKMIFQKVTAPYRFQGIVKVHSGKMVLEVQPSLAWGKGKIILWLLKQSIFPQQEASLVLYIGDDKTDEDAFRVLRKKGIPIVVGYTAKTSAIYHLNDIKEVIRFLRKIRGYMS